MLPGVVRLGLASAGFVLLGLMPAVVFLPPFMAGALLLVAAAVLGPEPRLHGLVAIWMVRLGDASYALYLLHPFVLRVLTVAWDILGLASPVAASLTCCAALVLASGVALVVHAWFEAPVTRGLTLRIRAART